MRTNVQKLRDLERWNVFEFKDNKYVPVYPFPMSWFEAYENLLYAISHWCVSSPAKTFQLYYPSSFVVLPQAAICL